MLGVDFTQSLQRKDRPGAVAQQALQSSLVVRFDAHAGIRRETPAVIPGAHGLRVFALEQPVLGERTQRTDAYLGLYFAKRFGAEGVGFVKVRAPGGIGLEHSIDNDAVKVHVGIEQSANAVDEGNRADPGRWSRTRAASANALFHRTQMCRARF